MIMQMAILKVAIVALLFSFAFGAQAKTYLVSVGIDDYSGYPIDLTNLKLCGNDAQSIADLYGNNASVDYSILLNEKATKERIEKAIKKVFKKAGKDDIIVFYFSGHGYPGGLCAANGSLTYKKVRDAMAESKCKNKLMFVDACMSGGMRVEKDTTKEDENSAKNSNVILFLSSRTNEYSIEGWNLANSLFTTYLIKGLKGRADTNKDRTITAKELFDYVHNTVAYESHQRQHPVMWGKFNNDMPVMKW